MNDNEMIKMPTLPRWLSLKVSHLNEREKLGFISGKVPALNGKSILELLGNEDGEHQIRDYISKIEGYGYF